MFDRKKIAAAAQEIADHVQLVDSVKALQVGQKEWLDTGFVAMRPAWFPKAAGLWRVSGRSPEKSLGYPSGVTEATRLFQGSALDPQNAKGLLKP